MPKAHELGEENQKKFEKLIQEYDEIDQKYKELKKRRKEAKKRIKEALEENDLDEVDSLSGKAQVVSFDKEKIDKDKLEDVLSDEELEEVKKKYEVSYVRVDGKGS